MFSTLAAFSASVGSLIDPTNAHKVHCILYVISASSILVETSPIMKEIIRIRESRKFDGTFFFNLFYKNYI